MKLSVSCLVGMGAAVYGLDAPFQKYPDCTSGPLAENKVCDRSLPPAERAAALVAALTNEEKLQNLVSKSKGASRLGLPAYNWWSEALHGVAYAPGTQFRDGPGDFNSSTSFPMPLLMAAAFDDQLIEDIGTVIGIEGRAFGNAGWSGMDYWTPNVNPFRDPRWGRGSETPGEDILRVKRYAASMVRGLEGPGPERRIVATCKHYAANDFEDWKGATRHNFNAEVSAQDLAEYYLSPFQHTGNWTEHDNYVTSDWRGPCWDVSAKHPLRQDHVEGTALCFEDPAWTPAASTRAPPTSTGASSQGLLSWDTVDRALRRLYQGIIRVGYFDGDQSPHAKLGWSDVNQPEAQRLALQVAAEGIVLLKNDGTLPIPAKKPNVAMIGFWADAGDKLSGGSAKDTWTEGALAAAQDADYILYFGGLDTSAAGETKDRMTIDWPAAQLALLEKLGALKKPLVVVQMGDQIDDTPLLEMDAVNSILWANWPGQDGGTAVLQLLSGAKSPAGRLPLTQYPANYTEAVPMTDMTLRPSATNPGRTSPLVLDPRQALRLRAALHHLQGRVWRPPAPGRPQRRWW
ncbi:hypothetical protein CHGG_03787 [Chaetomium globosum CBS 148.51]|uniref:xylan 1,4-beta-xylosidase n=1 Tax=Chaetomium globosum (strain ATCC 6205 / CBS 148.51 / DSM 1962 / NBRC 6347 / NRRL 1970) TaxID=306901 RepID=Q2H359_CHAGB|nr:uncharacterized protein CHGG_03787 [Chaetomium globosum CBS 148.51]EAQ87168.1 hypothetical protein CHGG_03787 [Chaetomium globosum CBS 148.51]